MKIQTETYKRIIKGVALFFEDKVNSTNDPSLFYVESSEGSGRYQVDINPHFCTCRDYQLYEEPCKHIWAARLYAKFITKLQTQVISLHEDNLKKYLPE